MPKIDIVDQMVQGIEEAEERTRIKEKLNEKYAEMSRLLARLRADAKNLSESFLRLKEANKQ